jgi:hypothetical protein
LSPDAPVAAPRGVRPGRALIVALAALWAMGTGSAQDAIDFNILSQPLTKALHDFSATSGIEVMVDARQAAGRTAPEVKGAMSPREALERLLAGSALAAHAFGPGTVTLSAIASAAPPSVDDLRYFADIQHALEQALCGDPRTAPGPYRLALKLWFGASGQVTRAQRLDNTSERSRDDLLDDMLPRINVGKPPPQGFVQPITLVVSPRAQGSASSCMAGPSSSRHAAHR